jgi:RNA polymerase sigma-70 factor (ECF subfamily)
MSIPSPLLDELAATANLGELNLTAEEFVLVLTSVGTKHNFGLPPEGQSTAAQQEKFLRALQLADLALARACALGREAAWQQFLARFRWPLRQAAIAVTGSSSLGEDLADSLYAELFGLNERDGQRRSPLASYSGRGSLMGWLRATLAQRHVDYHRRTWRESPMPEPESGIEFAAAPAQSKPEPAALSQLSRALAQTLQSLSPDDRFLLSAYFLDQRTLLEIARLLRVHEATVSRKLKRLTAAVHKQLLKQLQVSGLSKRAAEEALVTDPRDLTLNLRILLQTSSGAAFSQQKRGPNQARP